MARARTTSWLDGPRLDRPGGSETRDWPGGRLGLPAAGRGSAVGIGRRVGAIFIDWVMALLLTSAVTGVPPFTENHDPVLTLGLFAAEYVVFLSLIGCTAGMLVCGIVVVSLDGGRPRVPWVLARTVLLILVVPAVVYDRDYRGLHDRASNTVVVRR